MEWRQGGLHGATNPQTECLWMWKGKICILSMGWCHVFWYLLCDCLITVDADTTTTCASLSGLHNLVLMSFYRAWQLESAINAVEMGGYSLDPTRVRYQGCVIRGLLMWMRRITGFDCYTKPKPTSTLPRAAKACGSQNIDVSALLFYGFLRSITQLLSIIRAYH